MANLYRSNLKSDTSLGDVALVITTPPTKTTYLQGELFDPTDMVVTATMGDYSGNVVSKCTFSPAILSVAGTQNVRISYMGQFVTTSVTVNDVTILVTTPPTFTEFPTNSSLDLSGIVVTATDGQTSKDVTSECIFSPSNGTVLDTAGNTTITVTYQGHTTTTDVTVTDLVSISVTTPPTKTIYRNGETLDVTGIVVTAEYGDHTQDITGLCSFSPDTVSPTYEDITVTVAGETTTTPLYVVGDTLNATSWRTIQAIGKKGIGSQYFSIGDTKTIRVNGNIGSYIRLNRDLDVVLAHFNYRNQNGIYFVTFRQFKNNGTTIMYYTDAVIVDPNGQVSKKDGTKYINFNHTGGYFFGGWKGCDARYDILGSTNVAPSGYPGQVASGRVGYDATETCATNPVSNTLMAALPSDLRACMAPITIYTENSSTATHTAQATVTASIDYLPVPSEYELLGKRTNANQYEKNYQQQLSYFNVSSYPNERLTQRYDKDGSAYGRCTRSPAASGNSNFVGINAAGGSGTYSVQYTTGLNAFFRIG